MSGSDSSLQPEALRPPWAGSPVGGAVCPLFASGLLPSALPVRAGADAEAHLLTAGLGVFKLLTGKDAMSSSWSAAAWIRRRAASFMTPRRLSASYGACGSYAHLSGLRAARTQVTTP
eukprot:3773242-Rhodomonas_salina.2